MVRDPVTVSHQTDEANPNNESLRCNILTGSSRQKDIHWLVALTIGAHDATEDEPVRRVLYIQ